MKEEGLIAARTLQWRNYRSLEKQIQLRTQTGGNQPGNLVPLRRLASLISGAVRNAMGVCRIYRTRTGAL